MPSQGRVVHRDDLGTLTAWEREHLAELTGQTYRVLEPPRSYPNHSCAPNARQTEDAVFAWRAISPGEEITVDYRLDAHDDGGVWRMVCRCEAEPAPHAVVGGSFSLPDEVQARYLPFAPAFIQDEYRRRRGWTRGWSRGPRLHRPRGGRGRPDRRLAGLARLGGCAASAAITTGRGPDR